jgi:signal transduction histidine kinase
VTTSLSRRLRLLLLAGAGVLFVIGLVGALATRSLWRAQDDLIEHIQRARIAAGDLRAAALDQETGVRGYVLSQDASFLVPYRSGQTAAARTQERIARSMDGDARAEDALQRVMDALTHWRSTIGDQVVRQVQAGRTIAALGTLESGKPAFDEVRAALDAQDRLLTQRRDEAVGQTRSSLSTLVGVGSGSLVVLLVLGAMLGRALRRSVLDPLAALGSDARRVADGDLDHELQIGGPAEIADLTETVEAMRRRVTDELAVVAAARTQLAESAENLERSNRDLEQFAYIASHDLQEPLRKVAGFCQLLQRRYEGQLDERADEYIRFAVDGAHRMQDLISDLLDFSRVGRTTERFEPVDLEKTVDAAWADLRDDEGATLDRGALPTVSGDPTLLRVLFTNLFGNARKFRSERPPVVTVSAARVDDEWAIAVQDNGIGIDPSFGDRIFQIFQRLHTRDVYEGTGIGLALCKRIVELHGGHIELVPSEEGARFVVHLPVEATFDGTSASVVHTGGPTPREDPA